MINFEDKETRFALEAVRQAALLVKQVQAEMVSPALTKEDRSPVTVADYTAQALVGYLLAQAFPADRVVAEESSAALRQALAASAAAEAEKSNDSRPILEQVTYFVRRLVPEATPALVCDWIDHGRAETAPRFWTLDPIDGTKGFLRGDQYAVALALVIEGQVELGVLGCPNLTDGYLPDLNGAGSLIIARRGQGCWSTPLTQPGELKRLRVSPQSNPAQGRILRSFESGHTNADLIEDFAHRLGLQTEPVRMDSQAKYAVLAAGQAEFLLRLLSPKQPDYREKIWDQAAGSIILEEAGGKITDLDGRPLDFTTGRTLSRNRGILATNGLCHTQALNVLSEIGA